jgi:hypothetical protein
MLSNFLIQSKRTIGQADLWDFSTLFACDVWATIGI